MMPGIDGTLHIVTDHPAASATRGHRARIGIGQRDLFVFGLHHLRVQLVQALYLLAQRHDLLVEPRDPGFRNRFPLAVGTIRLGEVAGNALVDLRQPPLHLGLREVPVPRVDGFELAAVDRNAASLNSQGAGIASRTHGRPGDGLAVVLAEIGYRLEVRHQAAGQPHQLDIALALPLQAPARLHPIEVSVDVNLQQRAG